jgi:hypothetical protein
VRVELRSGVLEGRAVDVERDGRLVVLDACGVRTAWTPATSSTSARGDATARVSSTLRVGGRTST